MNFGFTRLGILRLDHVCSQIYIKCSIMRRIPRFFAKSESLKPMDWFSHVSPERSMISYNFALYADFYISINENKIFIA